MRVKSTICFFFSSRRRHTRWPRDWSSDVCSSDLVSVLGWITHYAGTGLRDRVRDRIARECLPGPAAAVNIEFTETGGHVVGLGMAVLALEAFLERVGLPSSSSLPAPASERSRTVRPLAWAIPGSPPHDPVP